jgi:hypothetical protein
MPTRQQDIEAREAKHGEKMIVVHVRFWTNDLAEQKGQIVRRHAKTGGIVRIERNAAHGITNVDTVPFNSLLELPWAIEKVLKANKVKLHQHQTPVFVGAEPPKAPK